MVFLRNIALFAICLIMAGFSAQAQVIEKSEKKEWIGGKEYYLHTVLGGQTLYSIAKAYNVNRDEIIELNPSAKDCLKKDQVLKIPVISVYAGEDFFKYTVRKKETLNQIAKKHNVKTDDLYRLNPDLTDKIKAGQVIKIPKPKKKPEVPDTGNHIIHTVEAGQTLFSIARQYGLGTDDLKKHNPGLRETIYAGQQIRIPAKKSPDNAAAKKADSIRYACDTSGAKKIYEVGLLLPFYLDHAWSIDTSAKDRKAKDYISFTFVGFYEGILMALDSLEKSGLSVKLHVEDVPEDTGRIPQLLSKPAFSKPDLIIGPLFHDNFNIVSAWAKEKQVKIVNPFSSRSEIVSGNPYVFKNVASYASQADSTASYIRKTWPGCNMILAHSGFEGELELLNAYRMALAGDSTDSVAFRESVYPREGMQNISKNMEAGKVNVVISLLHNEVCVSNFIRGLSDLSNHFPVVTFGQKSWEEYGSLEIEYLMDIKLHVLSSSFIDYSRSDVVDFIVTYRDRFLTEPDPYAFAGYDVAMYYLNALRLYGNEFQNCLSRYDPDLLQTHVNLVKQEDGGWENAGICIYRYHEFRLVDAYAHPLIIVETTKRKY